MYFVVDENGLKTVYAPRKGKSLDNYKWIDISLEEPEFIPLKFEVNENKNAYFSLTRGGGRLSVVASFVDMIEDEMLLSTTVNWELKQLWIPTLD